MKRSATFFERWLFAAVMAWWLDLSRRAPRDPRRADVMILTPNEQAAHHAAISIAFIEGPRIGLHVDEVTAP